MSTLQIVIPMAGRGSRFAQAGFTEPKPLISVGGKPMIQWVIDNIRPARPHVFTFICLGEHLDRYPDLAPRLREICPGANVVRVNAVTEGAACTVLLARDIIDSDEPLMMANSDQVVEVAIDDYLAAGDDPSVDGWIMTFGSDHPKWSYARLSSDGTVSEVVEKQVVSNEATVGIYNFRRGADFVRGAEAMIAANFRVNGEFYVAPVYNQLIAAGRKIIVYRIGEEYNTMHGVGTPEDLKIFLNTDYFLGQRDRLKGLT